MELPEIKFDSYCSEGRIVKSSSEHKAIFTKLLADLTRNKPQLKPTQIKAMAVQKFMAAGGINVVCVESIEDGQYGIDIYTEDKKNKLAFIKNNCVIVNALNELHAKGVFDEA